MTAAIPDEVPLVSFAPRHMHGDPPRLLDFFRA
jgi:hypothetical protein